MKALSLWQPWATLLVIGEKKIETRHWYTPYRGPLLIHAAKRFTRDEREQCQERVFSDALSAHGFNWIDLPLGAFVGKVMLKDCIRMTPENTNDLSEKEWLFGNYAPGRYMWICDNPIHFEPIPAKGQQGLWIPDKTITSHE